MTQQSIILAIICTPLAGAIVSYVLGRFHPRASSLIASCAAAISFYLVSEAFRQLTQMGIPIRINFGEWFQIASLSVEWSFLFDQLSALMCLLITGVGTLIHIYSIGYMAADEGQPRFFSYLNLFLSSMLVLVLAGSFPVLFIGWEGVGLCSYLLIGFWFQNPAYAKAAQKAFVMNRIGDLGLLLCMFILFFNFNTLEISTIIDSLKSGLYSTPLLTVLGALLLLAAFGKSAQFPLFTWLPDAMAGPTPVSALIHAATMVTAGVYLVARMFPIFEGAPELQMVLAIIAVFTAFITATIALAQNDIKKVLAYSTVSQLGFMFIALAAGAYWVAIFHLLTHGFFKACLFLAAGSVIHGCHHQQDMRKMGGLARAMPITFICFTLATLAIAGIAPFSGYYSKHAIMDAFGHFVSSREANALTQILASLVTVTSFLTAFYMGRCLVLTFFGHYRGEQSQKPHEVAVVMWGPVLVLAILSLVAGWIFQEPIFGLLTMVLPQNPTLHLENISDAFSHSWLGAFGLVVAIISFSLFPLIADSLGRIAEPLLTFFRRGYLLDEFYEAILARPLQFFAWFLWKVGDDLVLETTELTGVIATRAGGSVASYLQSGHLRHYAGFLFLGMAGLLYLLIG